MDPHNHDYDDRDGRLRKELGRRLQEARSSKGIKQTEVAEELGKGDRAVSAWETGRTLPDALVLRFLAVKYDTSADNLLGLTRPENGDKFMKAAEELAEISDGVKLPLRDFLRIIRRGMAMPPDNERDDLERKEFVRGLIAGLQMKD